MLLPALLIVAITTTISCLISTVLAFFVGATVSIGKSHEFPLLRGGKRGEEEGIFHGGLILGAVIIGGNQEMSLQTGG